MTEPNATSPADESITLDRPPADAADQTVLMFNWNAMAPAIEAEGDITDDNGALVISRIEVWSQLTTGVTPEVLGQIPLEAALAKARAQLSWTADAVAAQPIQVPPARHTAMTDELLRDVARAYLEASSSKDRSVVKKLEERFQRPRGTIITWITRARKEGWLGPSVKGRLGVEPGPKLVAWIHQVVADSQNTTREARRIAEEWGGATPGVVSQALRAYNDIAERDISHHMGLPPLEAAVASQVLFGRSLSAELAERQERAGGSREYALNELLVQMQGEFRKRAQDESGSSVSPSGNK